MLRQLARFDVAAHLFAGQVRVALSFRFFDCFAYVRLDVGRQLDELRACARSHHRELSTRQLRALRASLIMRALLSSINHLALADGRSLCQDLVTMAAPADVQAGRQLRALRVLLGLKQAEVAARARVSRTSVVKLEAGRFV